MNKSLHYSRSKLYCILYGFVLLLFKSKLSFYNCFDMNSILICIALIALLVSQYRDKNQLGKEFSYPTPTGRDSGGVPLGLGGLGWIGRGG